jgi:hypothetical protein
MFAVHYMLCSSEYVTVSLLLIVDVHLNSHFTLHSSLYIYKFVSFFRST